MTVASPVSPAPAQMPGADRVMRIAVVAPCYNEEVSAGDVIAGFRSALPEARIYIYDNNSTDRTVEVAQDAGAEVRTERRQGKGNVVRRMFADIDADVVVRVDGDNTYHPESAPRMIERREPRGRARTCAMDGERIDMGACRA